MIHRMPRRRDETITPVHPDPGTPPPAPVQFLGTRLVERTDPDATTSTDLGWVVAIPQVPPWMSEYYPDVVDASQNGGPAIADYTQEWFERIVWISDATIATVTTNADPQQLDLIAQFDTIRMWLAPPASRGCAKSAPILNLYEVVLDSGNLIVERSSTRYRALIEGFADVPTSLLSGIAVIPITNTDPADPDDLQDFVDSTRHGLWHQYEIDQNHQVPALAGQIIDAIKIANP